MATASLLLGVAADYYQAKFDNRQPIISGYVPPTTSLGLAAFFCSQVVMRARQLVPYRPARPSRSPRAGRPCPTCGARQIVQPGYQPRA